MVTDTSAFDRIFLRLSRAGKNSVKEIMDVVLLESKTAYLSLKKKNVITSGHLFGSFAKEEIIEGPNLTFSGIVYVGGPSAPYAPIVDQIGWEKRTGHKDAYNFMRIGAEKGAEVAGDIVIKHLSKIM